MRSRLQRPQIPMLLSEEQHTKEGIIMMNETVRKLQEMRLSVMAKTYLVERKTNNYTN